MGSVYGRTIRVSIFGQSHSAAIGVVVDGLPAGHELDLEALRAFMARRAPGASELATARREADEFEILSGLSNGRLCGAPFAAQIRNTNARSGDYEALRDTPRPGHADYTARVKHRGFQDPAGGGHFSGRLTAPLCLAGGLILQLLEKEGVRMGAHVERIGTVCDRRFDPLRPELSAGAQGALRVMDREAGERMAAAILEARVAGDSLGGVIECAITGLPAGVGDPMFDGLENRIAQAVFAIPAVKGIEFGSGFAGAGMRGSEHNDAFCLKGDAVVTRTNRHGGILGGISSGMPVLFRVAIKPTPSIYLRQQTVNLALREPAELAVRGRHDPCIVPRALPCVEAAAAIAAYDAYLDYKKER